jgi:hypothetical protein
MSFTCDIYNEGTTFKNELAIKKHIAKLEKVGTLDQINVRYRWEFYEDSSSENEDRDEKSTDSDASSE